MFPIYLFKKNWRSHEIVVDREWRQISKALSFEKTFLHKLLAML